MSSSPPTELTPQAGAAQAPLTLRDAVRPADAPLVEQLVRDTGFFHPEEVLVARELVETYLSQGPASGYVFLFAEREGVTLGYACYGPIPMSDRRYDLYWIATAPQAQRGGIGKALLRAVEADVARRGGARIYVETSSKPLYAPTREFYLRAGYHLEATLPGFYADHDDKLIYTKYLQ
jgi:ribosomal protein S18 acetylase RimI-like enzyme